MADLFDTFSKMDSETISNIAGAANAAEKAISEKVGQAGEYLARVAGDSGIDLSAVSANVQKTLDQAGNSVLAAVDQNGNSQIDIQDILILVFKTPGMKINRAEFLQNHLKARYTQETVDKAVASSPVKAEIPPEELDQLAAACIAAEANKAHRISKVPGIQENVAIVATYGFMIRAVQELLYLYGFPDLGLSQESEEIDAGAQNILILCIGVINGIEGADDAIRAVAKALGTGMEKSMLQKALTQGIIQPFVINVGKWFAAKMAKDVGAGLLRKIPLAGGLLADTIFGAGLTKNFVPSCNRLMDVLRDTYLTRGDIPGRQDEDILLEMAEDGK